MAANCSVTYADSLGISSFLQNTASILVSCSNLSTNCPSPIISSSSLPISCSTLPISCSSISYLNALDECTRLHNSYSEINPCSTDSCLTSTFAIAPHIILPITGNIYFKYTKIYHKLCTA